MACLCSPPPPSPDAQLSSKPSETRLDEAIRQRKCPERIKLLRKSNAPDPVFPFRCGTAGVALLWPSEVSCASFRVNMRSQVQEDSCNSRKSRANWWLGTRGGLWLPPRTILAHVLDSIRATMYGLCL
ncbi:hypothetical protein M408DRAFT_329636 [Serendipita vermifera MAFF 305830]|uniref:Uncharacterized protein n=1 Tax=Serendipita vermifera MAFF 305830 TaxID=933852 RepID=A0A0C3B929_SERVB|nr:hypothetical protein M408DRAFT_329636 [Serendipita vermifera MAFF 305830]